MKLVTQPYIIIILIVYSIYTLCRRSEDTKKERIFNEIKTIKKIINEFVDKYIFVWNNFNEKIITEKDNRENNNEKNEDNKLSFSQNLTERNNINMKRLKSQPNIIRKKRKGSNDENENNKTKYQKLLGKIDEEENEEGEEQKVLGFIKKFREVKKRVSLFWSDNIFIRIKKYSILSIIGFFLCSPIINGVFGYGYYVFYESDVYRCFQIELILCFVFGFILILLTEE